MTITHSISAPLAQTPTSTTGQEINIIRTQTTNPALQSQMPNLMNMAIAEPTPITTHPSTTLDTKGIKIKYNVNISVES